MDYKSLVRVKKKEVVKERVENARATRMVIKFDKHNGGERNKYFIMG